MRCVVLDYKVRAELTSFSLTTFEPKGMKLDNRQQCEHFQQLYTYTICLLALTYASELVALGVGDLVRGHNIRDDWHDRRSCASTVDDARDSHCVPPFDEPDCCKREKWNVEEKLQPQEPREPRGRGRGHEVVVVRLHMKLPSNMHDFVGGGSRESRAAKGRKWGWRGGG